MALIMSEVRAVGKDSKNLQQGYQYRGIDAIYNALNELMGKYKVIAVPVEIRDKVMRERTSKSGSILFEFTAEFTYRFYAEDLSSIDAHVMGKGMDSGDKDTNKAMAVAHKYALLQAFCIPTDEQKDPEKDTHETISTSPVVRVSQETANESIKVYSAILDSINVINDKEILVKKRNSFEEYVMGDKNKLNDYQIKNIKASFDNKLLTI